MRRFLLAVASTILGMSTVGAQEIPRIDIEATCREARALTPEDTNPYAGCVDDETSAVDQLRASWVTSSRQHRETCTQETQIAGSPSYVELLTCLQMYGSGTSTNVLPRRLRPPK